MEDNLLKSGGVSLVNKYSNLNEEEIKNQLTESKFKVKKKNTIKKFSFKNLKTNSLIIYSFIFAILLFGFLIALLIYLLVNDKAYIELDSLESMFKPKIYEEYEYKLFQLKDNELDILLIKDKNTLIASISVCINIGYKTFKKNMIFNNNNDINNNVDNDSSDSSNDDLGLANLLKNYLVYTFPVDAKKKLNLFNGTITSTIEDYYTIFNLNILNSQFYDLLPYFAKLFTYSEEEFMGLIDANKENSMDLDHSTESDYYQVAYDNEKLDKRFISYFIYKENVSIDDINMTKNLDYEGIQKNKNIKKYISKLYDFYKKYYTSNNMKIVIYSYYKINKLIENCVHYFKNIDFSNLNFSYKNKTTNNDISPTFYNFEQKTSSKTIKIFYVIDSNSENYLDDLNNLNYLNYFIKKNSLNDSCSLLNKLFEYLVFDIQTKIYEEINYKIIYKIEISLNDTDTDDNSTIEKIINQVFKFVKYYSKKEIIASLKQNLSYYYDEAFKFIEKQDKYDSLTNFAAKELFFKKDHYSKFLQYKYLTDKVENINKMNFNNAYILISKIFKLTDINYDYVYTYKTNISNDNFSINLNPNVDNYSNENCNFTMDIIKNENKNKFDILELNFSKNILNNSNFSYPIMHYLKNNDLKLPKVSFIFYIFNYYSKIKDETYRLSYFLYYIQLKTLILEKLFDYIEAGNSIEINTNELGIYVNIVSLNYYITDIIHKIFEILYENDFIPEENVQLYYLNKLYKEIDLYNLDDPSLLNQDYFLIAKKQSPIIKYNLTNLTYIETLKILNESYNLIKKSLPNILTNGLLYGNIDYISAENIFIENYYNNLNKFKFNISNCELCKNYFNNTNEFILLVQNYTLFFKNKYTLIYIISEKRVTTAFSNYYYLGKWSLDNDIKADLFISIIYKYLKEQLRKLISQKSDLKVSKIIFSKQIYLDVTVTTIKKDKFNYNTLNNKIDEVFKLFNNSIEKDYENGKEIDIADNYYFLIRSYSNFMTLKEQNIKEKAKSQWFYHFMANQEDGNESSAIKEDDKYIYYNDINFLRNKFNSGEIKNFLINRVNGLLFNKLTLIFIDSKLHFNENSTFNSTILDNNYSTIFRNEYYLANND